MEIGAPVLLRSIYKNNVRWCFPHHFVGEWDGRVGIYCMPGNQGKVIKRHTIEHYLESWAGDGPPFDHVWGAAHVLRFMRPGDRHTVEVFWDADWELMGWYVNLQAPLAVNGGRFDTTDWALDVVVEPNGEWSWKDEDDLAKAVELGIFDDREAASIREYGERVIEERPWPTGWEDWRPPADWAALSLPHDWAEV